MFAGKNVIQKQSIALEVDFDEVKIHGLTTMSIKIEDKPMKSEIGETYSYEIHFCAKQLEVESIDISSILIEDEAYQVEIDKENISRYFRISTAYPNLVEQAESMSKLAEAIRGINFWLRFMKTNQNYENKGLLKFNIDLLIKNGDKFLENGQVFNIEKLQRLSFMLKIEYKINQPFHGLRFYLPSNQKEATYQYLFNDNKIGYTRYWVPCLDDVNHRTHIDKIKVLCPADYYVIASGELTEHVVDEEGNKSLYVYSVDKKLQFNQIGLFVGKLEKVEIVNENMKFYCFCRKVKEEDATYTFKTSNLLDRIYEFHKTYMQEPPLSNYKMIVLPNLSSSLKSHAVPLSFYQMAIIDEDLLLSKKVLDEINLKKFQIFRSINWSHLHGFRIISVNEYWIKIGLNSYLADFFLMASMGESAYKLYITKKTEKLLEYIYKGREVYPLASPMFSHEAEIYIDKCWTLKCCIVMHMLANVISMDNTTSLIKKILNNDKDKAYNNENFFKMIKMNFGIKNIKYFKNQFIKQTGCPQLDCEYTYHRKENKIDLVIVQHPLQEEYFREQTKYRYLLCKHYNYEDEGINILNNFSLEENTNFWENNVLVNARYKSCRYFSGKMTLIASETNEVELKDEAFPIILDKNKETRIPLNCRSKFRKTLQKKLNDYDENSSHVDRSFMNSSLQEAPRKKMSLFTLNNSSRNPAQWVKIDVDNCFLKKIKLTQPENIWLLQLTKENEREVGGFYFALQALRSFETPSTVDTLCSLLEMRASESSEYSMKREIVEVLLSLSPETTGFRGFENLFNQIKKIRIEADGSLKYNDFSNVGEYHLLIKMIHKLSQVREKPKLPRPGDQGAEAQTNPKMISLLLKLIQENQNSNNAYDDSFYMATLLESLLFTKNPMYLDKILFEIKRYFNLEKIRPSYQYIILKKMLNRYCYFLEENHLLHKSEIKSAETLSILKAISVLIKDLHRRYQHYPGIMQNYFKYKLNKKFAKKKKIWFSLVFGLKFIEEYKSQGNFVMAENLIMTLYNFVIKNKPAYFEMQKILTENSNRSVVDILWDALNGPASSINIVYRHYMFLIYREIYYDYVPICYAKDFKEDVEIDLAWLNFEEREKQIKEQQKEKKFITLNYLKVHRRKISNTDKTKVNPRELIWSRFRHVPDPQVTWQKLARQILSVLLSEKITEDVEKKINDASNAQDNEGENFVIKIKNIQSMKIIRKNLVKDEYDTMVDVQDALHQVVQYYRKQGYINEDVREEYENFIDVLFAEAKNIYADYNKAQDEKFKNMKIKIKGDII